MDANLRPDPAAGVEPPSTATGGDWHQPEARSRIVNKITEALKKRLPVSAPEELNQLREIAVRYENRIYTQETNQSDYLRKISLKILFMEMKTQQAPRNATVIPERNNSSKESPIRTIDGPTGSEPAGGGGINPPLTGGDWRAQLQPEARSRIVDKMPPLTGGDWRAQLQPEARSRIVDKIMVTLKMHLPISAPEGQNELQKIAVRFEERMYTLATNQSDYLRKISLKMLAMESKAQQAHGNAQVIPDQNNSSK
uniref:Mediator complex subunit 15 KIX domain-containing protein n=2 Tax=Triticum urartu TaxID=4572 RepID=A0A8R7VAG8_TRIUA